MKVTLFDLTINKTYFFNLPLQLKDYKKTLTNIMTKMHNFSIYWG